MGIFDHLALGFGVAFTVNNLLFCFLGVLIGTLIGVLPGIGPVATISLLLPVTFGMNPVRWRAAYSAGLAWPLLKISTSRLGSFIRSGLT